MVLMIMQQYYQQFEQRKQDHIDFSLKQANQTPELSGLEIIRLEHDALPDLNFDEVCIKTKRFGQTINTPFFVSSMTAGHKEAIDINRRLMKACSHTKWWMGVGSQRRELTDKKASNEWKLLRQEFPEVALMSNIGLAQIISHRLQEIKILTENLNACALIVHLNPLQECIQPEGTPQFKGGLKALEQLVKAIDIPIIVKETGCGFSKKTLKRLIDIGIDAIDVSGTGGTHWGRIEGMRATPDSIEKSAASTFKNWGINSIESIKNAMSLEPNCEIWGSGGVRNGLDSAKLIALGATSIGLAKPLLEAALISVEHTVKLMQAVEHELKIALFCSGSPRLCSLKEALC
jgi:isopentenyl-diphosphate Delta-isomerase